MAIKGRQSSCIEISGVYEIDRNQVLKSLIYNNNNNKASELVEMLFENGRSQ